MLVLVGGGSRPVRLYRPTGQWWLEVEGSGLPERLVGSVLAAADWDGDGRTDLFLGNLPRPLSAASDPTDPSHAVDLIGKVYRRLGPTQFEPMGPEIEGPASAAVALDADGDGDQDLIVARALEPAEAAAGHLLRRADMDPPSVPQSVTLWRNANGRLVPEPAAMPPARCTVQDLAVTDIDGNGLPDLYLATGGLLPEQVQPDRLWLNTGGRFVDASPYLGRRRFATTLRVWPLSALSLLLLRGGTVPANPGRLYRLTLGKGVL